MKSICPQKLSFKEKQKLRRSFYLPGWQFDSLIGNNCVKISDHIIGWQKPFTKVEDEQLVEATLYGLQGMDSTTKKPLLCKYFLQYKARVFQPFSIVDAVSLIELIEKEFKWDEYDRVQQRKLRKIKRLQAKKGDNKSSTTINKAA